MSDTAVTAAARRGGGRRRATAWLALAAVVLASAALLAWRWAGAESRADPDSWWYARGALIYSGSSTVDAERDAARFMCEHHWDGSPATPPPEARRCSYRAVAADRYARIFTTRPGYPLLAAPLVPVLGVFTALSVVTALSFLGIGVLMFSSIRRSGGGLVAALVGLVAFDLLPSGFWATRLLADGPMLLGMMLVIWGLLDWTDGRRRGLAVAVAGLALTFVVKSANGVALVTSLVALGALATLLGPAALRRRHAAIVALGAAFGIAWTIVSVASDLPSLTETVQDLSTAHFTRPDNPDPWAFLLHRDKHLWVTAGSYLAAVPGLAVLVVAGTGALVTRLRWRAIPWVAVGSTGMAAVLVHPVESEIARLLVPLWVPVAAGLGLLMESIIRKVRDLGRSSTPTGAAA